MTLTQLKNIRQLILAAEIDCDRLSVEEIEDLRTTVENEIYQQSVEAFRNHLVFALPNRDEQPNEESFNYELKKFYNTDWGISFGGKSVMLHNSAQVYNTIRDLLYDLT